MTYPQVEETKPDKRLTPYVIRWVLMTYDSSEPFPSKVAPSGTIFINHAYDSEHPQVTKDDKVMPPMVQTAFIGHPLHKSVRILHQGVHKEVLVEFTDIGFYQLFKIPVYTLIDTEPHIAELGFADLSDSIKHLKDPEKIKQIINRYLLKLAESPATIEPEILQLCESIKAAIKSQSLKRSKEISALTNYSQADRKRIYRLFRKYIGLSPKQYQRVFSLNSIMNLVKTEDYETLSELAIKSGYYDHADFDRHFKSYFESTPSIFIEEKSDNLAFDFLGSLAK